MQEDKCSRGHVGCWRWRPDLDPTIPQGKGAKTPFVLRQWQQDIVGGLIPETGDRPRQGVISLPRGNGKSALASVLAAYFLFADTTEGAEVLCVATEELRRIADAPWRDLELNPHKLGHRLGDYGIRTGHNAARTERGYRLQDFRDAFERYLGTDPSRGVQSVPQSSHLRKGLAHSSRRDGSKSSSARKPPQDMRRSGTVRTQVDGSGPETANVSAKRPEW